MSADTLTAVLTGVQLLVVAATLLYLARQVRGEQHAIGFQVYTQVSDAYREHLWLATERPVLNDIWEPWDPVREQQLRAAQVAGGRWGAWYEANEDERLCYRYTRAALEIFEQAWEVRRRGQIPDDTWRKWQHWMAIWKTTRFYDFVFEDTRPRLITGFCEELTQA